MTQDPQDVTGESARSGNAKPHAEFLRAQFRLRAMMIWIALIAVVLGLFIASRAWGIILCLLAIPALAHTNNLVEARNTKNLPTSFERYLWIFVVSFCSLALSLGCAAAVAFCVMILLQRPYSELDSDSRLAINGLAVVLVCYLFLMIRLWRYRG
jgi:hypothetical protein